jgi:hypothetical protein
VTVVANAEVALFEGSKPIVELQNTGLTAAEQLSLDREPRVACGLRQFLNDFIEFQGKGVRESCHHDVVQSSPIDRQISDIRDDVVVQGVVMKREKHEVVPPLVVGR